MRYLIITCATLLLSACIKKKDYPITPVIEFKSVGLNDAEQYANFIIGFKDGDGDLGVMGEEVSNAYFKLLYKDNNGVFQALDSNLLNTSFDTVIDPFQVNLPLTPTGKNKAVEGDFIIKKDYPLYYAGNPIIPKQNFIKYEIWIVDRAGHISNRIQTNELDVTAQP